LLVNTPLHRAATSGNREAVKALIGCKPSAYLTPYRTSSFTNGDSDFSEKFCEESKALVIFAPPKFERL
jgi:hypothetical protein